METETVQLGLSHFWSQADALIRATSFLLLAMSVLSWFLILWKTWAWLRVRSAARQLDAFWAAASLDVAVADLRGRDPEALFVPLAQSAANAAQNKAAEGSLAAQVDRAFGSFAAFQDKFKKRFEKIGTGTAAAKKK